MNITMKHVRMMNDVLTSAAEANLTAEVVFTALEAMKDNGKLSPLEAMLIGAREWDTIIKHNIKCATDCKLVDNAKINEAKQVIKKAQRIGLLG